MKNQSRRFGYRGGIHFFFQRYTWRQQIKNLIDYMSEKEER